MVYLRTCTKFLCQPARCEGHFEMVLARRGNKSDIGRPLLTGWSEARYLLRLKTTHFLCSNVQVLLATLRMGSFPTLSSSF